MSKINRPNNRESPYIENQFVVTVIDEARAIGLFMRHQWYYALAVILAIAVLIFYFEPLPPSHIRLSKGQPNSSLEVEAKYFKQALEENGIKTELIESKGTLDSLKLLEDKKVDIALSQSGLPIKRSSDIVSLGSLGYQALWFFYVGPQFQGDDISRSFENKKIYINRPGSGTNFMVEKLLKIYQKQRTITFQKIDDLSPQQAVEALKIGKIDGMFLLAGYDSLNVQSLLADPKVQILNFPVAQALSLEIKGVDIVTLPKGVFSLSPPRPTQDIKMVAVATTLFAKKNLHPEIQYLLLESAKERYYQDQNVFDRPGGFPEFTERGVPRSQIAEKFYERGPPLLASNLPHWLASFIEYAWFSLLALFAIVYPLMQFRPSYRKYIYTLYTERLYTKIFDLTSDVEAADSLDEINECIRKTDALYKKVLDLWVPKGCKDAYGSLINAMAILIAQGKERQQILLTPKN